MMPSGYAAMAETYVEGIGTLTSLGKAGFAKDGSRKPEGCMSLANARRRVVWSLVNKLRSRLTQMKGLESWMKRRDLELRQPELYHMYVEMVTNNAVWVESGPSTYVSRIDGTDILRVVMAEVCA